MVEWHRGVHTSIFKLPPQRSAEKFYTQLTSNGWTGSVLATGKTHEAMQGIGATPDSLIHTTTTSAYGVLLPHLYPDAHPPVYNSRDINRLMAFWSVVILAITHLKYLDHFQDFSFPVVLELPFFPSLFRHDVLIVSLRQK